MLDYLDKFLNEADIDLSDLEKILIEEPGNTFSVSDSWPLGERELVFYLSIAGDRIENGRLSLDMSSGGQLDWRIDPEAMAAKEMDYPELIFRSDPFQHDLLIAGNVKLDLWIKASSPDVDFFAYLYKRSQSGEEQLLTRMAVRAKYRHDSSEKKWLTGQDPILLELSANDFVYKVMADNIFELRLVNNRPFSLENPLTGEPLLKQTHRNSSQVSLYLGGRYPSKIVLPVVHREKRGLKRR
jgi:predicted acyl esterase